MKPLIMLYHALQIKQKLPDEGIRLMYLNQVWGMEQKTIGECEGKSQSYVSLAMKVARSTTVTNHYKHATELQWTLEEIKYIQFLPRDVLSDVQVLSFITDVLNLQVIHPFFQHYAYNINTRMCALYSLGIPIKRIQEIFKKGQSTVSMAIKRGGEDYKKYVRTGRYDSTAEYKIQVAPKTDKFVPSGGGFHVW